MGDETRRLDRLMKKVKPFFDEKQKAKNRLNAFCCFIDGSNDEDQAKFFQEHDHIVYSVLKESFWHLVEKIRGKDKADKPAQIGSKESIELLKVTALFRKTFVLLPERIRAGWHVKGALQIVKALVAHQNHPRLRLEGLRILLSWINDVDEEIPELTALYASVLQLDLFEPFVLPVGYEPAGNHPGSTSLPKEENQKQNHTPENDNNPVSLQLQEMQPIIPWASAPTPSDSIELFEEILLNIAILSVLACSGTSSRLGYAHAFLPASPALSSSPSLDGQLCHKSLDMSGLELDDVENTSEEVPFQEDPVPDGLVANVGALKAATAQWQYVKRWYLFKLFPTEAGRHNRGGNSDFQTCPLPFLQSFLSFIIRYMLDPSVTGLGLALPEHLSWLSSFGIHSKATSLLRRYMLSSTEDRSLISEVVRQGLLVPFSSSDISRSSLFIIRTWLFSPESKEASTDGAERNFDGEDCEPETVLLQRLNNCCHIWTNFEIEANTTARRLLENIRLLFLDRRDFIDYSASQVGLYKEALQIYKLLVVEAFFPLTSRTWRLITDSLLNILEALFCRPNKYASIATPSLAEEVCGIAVETVLLTWIRFGSQSEADWVNLRAVLEKCSGWMQTVHQWANTVTKMTKVFGLFSFGVDVDMIRDDYETRGAIRLRAASFQSSRPKSSISSSSSHITINNRIALQTEKSFGSSLGSAVEVTQNPSSPLPALVAESAPSSSLLFNLDNEIAALDPPPSPMHPIRLPPVGGAPTSLTDGGLLEGAMPITKAVALVENDSALKQELRDANKSSTHSIKSHQSAEGVNEKLERSTGAANGYGGSTNLHLPTSGQNFLSKVNDFPNLLTITWWNAASGSFVWKNLLCCLGDVNKLSNPQNHAEAMNCLSQTWDMLAKIRSAQTYENAQIPPLFDFFPWFAKATELSSDFAEGRECGYSSLCKLMAKRHEQPLELDVVSHFYRCILRGLGTDDLKVVSSILSNSTAIFLVNLPGSSILIPHFVRAINKLLVGSRDNTSVSTIVRQSAIKILHSMSAIPNLHLQTSMFSTSDLPRLPNSHLTVAEGLSSSSDIMRSLSEPFLPKKRAEGTNRSLSREDSISTDDEFSPLSDSIFDSSRSLAEETLTIPSLDWNNPAITEDHVTFDEIKTQITDLYSSLLKDEGNLKCSETTAMLIWGVSALCCEELFNSSRLKGNMGETCLNLLLSQLTSKDAKSVSAAVDGLSLLASNSLILRRVEARTLINVVEKIVGAIGEHILCNQARVSRESRNLIVTRLLYCLLDWMMLLPNHIIEESTVSVLIFEVLESCLELGSEYDGSETATAAKAVHGNANMRANSLLSAAVAKVAMSPVPGVPIAQTALTVTAGTGTETTRGKLEAEEDDDDFVVKEAAENVLLHFSHHFNNFAPPYGAAIMNSQYVESILSEEMKENDRTIFFTLNDTTILTFCMCYTSGDAKARIIMRDLTGRYVWDYENFWQGLADVCCENPQGEKQFSQGFTLPIHQNVESEDSKPDAFGCEIAGDELNSLIQSIRQENEDCLEHMKSSGSIEDEGFSEQAAQMSEIIERNVSTEAFYHDKFRKNNSLVYRRFQKLAGSKGFVLEQPPASTALDDFANFPRLYLTQMGHINFDSLKDGYLHILAKSPALIRDIKGLDRKMGREVMKVAIIYVGPGQEEEQVLLRNGRGSAEYEEFVLSLGWEVDVQSHLGYLGGLEKSQATGSTAVYYCDSRTEIIFHDITRFPLDPEDPKQLKRKRHIGNDHVHIIWNEHYRDYKRTTIGGDFGNAQIVITPLANKLYSVDIMKDSKVASFGPLQHRMAVSKGVLGPLVRATAANAFRSALHIGQIHSGPPHAFSQRLSDIKTIISRHANSKSTFQTFFLALFNQPKKGEKYCE